MANLAKDAPRTYSERADVQDFTIALGTILYQGAALSDVSSTSPGVAGTNVAANLTAGENFLGFCERQTSATDLSVPVKIFGYVDLVVTGVLAASVGAPVYASDGNTFTLTATSNSRIGRVKRIVNLAATLVTVEFRQAEKANIGFTGGAGNDLTHFAFVDGLCTAAS